jgi:hypothetical protein
MPDAVNRLRRHVENRTRDDGSRPRRGSDAQTLLAYLPSDDSNRRRGLVVVVKAGVLAFVAADQPGIRVFVVPDELENPCIVIVIYLGRP